MDIVSEMKYSVLMSVYYKEKAEYLRQAMQSMWDQTIPTDDFVLVCDGPLTVELDAVIEDMQKKYAETLHVVRLQQNSGLGNALNEGLKYCIYEYVARMDSDDISKPERCEKELEVFVNNPELSIVGSVIEEFETTPGDLKKLRVVPETNEEIREFAKKRNPFNHPSVMFKKSAVLSVGGYIELRFFEDYYLWIRLIVNDLKGYNLLNSLVYMRLSLDSSRRRGGINYIQSPIILYNYMVENNYISQFENLNNVFIRFISSILPNRLRYKLIYGLLRKKNKVV